MPCQKKQFQMKTSGLYYLRERQAADMATPAAGSEI